jgi:hypothetical protein
MEARQESTYALHLTPLDADLIVRALKDDPRIHDTEFWNCAACALITRIEGHR